MSNLDLRQVGTIMGLPIYVDFASIKDYKGKKDILSTRDLKYFMVTTMFKKAFGMDIQPTTTKQEEK